MHGDRTHFWIMGYTFDEIHRGLGTEVASQIAVTRVTLSYLRFNPFP